MPQPNAARSTKSSSAKKPAAKKSTAAGRKSAAAAKPAAKRTTSRAAAAKPAAKKTAAKPAARKTTAKPAAKKTAAKPAAKKPAAKRTAAAAKSATSRSSTTAKRSASASKPAAKKATSTAKKTATSAAKTATSAAKKTASTARKTATGAAKKATSTARKAAPSSAKKPAARRPAAKRASTSGRRSAKTAGGRPTASPTARDEALRENLQSLREVLAGGVVLTAQGIQETLDQAVTNGRMLRRDAEEVTRGLVEEGRRQTQLLLADVEQLLGRGRTDLGSAAGTARSVAETAAGAAGDRVLREVDRARRAAHVGPSFPILTYDELTAEQIVDRLADLTPAELRKVRDHERRGKDRARVVDAIERALK